MGFHLDDDTLHGLAGGQLAPEPATSSHYSGRPGLNKALIAIIFGCLFLLAALGAFIIALTCLWGGVFNNTEPLKATAGFFGGVLVGVIASVAGWRFISRA